MRLKRLLGVWLVGICLPLVPVVSMAAAASQLTKVSVAEQGSATAVILQANGTFTHAEYRPTENLLLVDLPGVAAGMLKDTGELVNRSGIASYRVVSYLGSNGSEVTRVELVLSAGAKVDVAEGNGELRLMVEGTQASAPQASASAPATETATTMPPVAATENTVPKSADAQLAGAAQPELPVAESSATAAPEPTEPMAPPSQKVAAVAPASTGKLAVVRKVSVAHSDDGLAVEIQASGPVQPVAMKLDSPDRIVVDIPNSRLAGRQQPIHVNQGGLKTVRVGRFQADPPVTRIVLDVAAAQEYELVPQGSKVLVRLRDGSSAGKQRPVVVPASRQATPTVAHLVRASAPANPMPEMPVSNPVAAVEKAPQPVTAKEVAAAEPVVASPPMPKAEPREMAEAAAKVMQASRQPAPLIAMPAVSAAPAALPQMAQAQPAPAPQAPAAAQAAAQPAQAPEQPRRYTGEPISVNLKDVDLQDFFRLIHEISGLNIVLDPAVKGTLTLVLDDVPWDQALDIVLQNNGLDRHLEGNVLRIATRETFTREAEARRAQAEAQALAVDPAQYTHYLSYAHAVDVVPLVRRFLTQRGEVLADPRTNALLIRDIPSVIPEVQRLLGQLDRKTQEVEIEARVVAATRNFARDIGTQLGFGWGNSTTAVGGGSAAGNSPINQTYLAPPPYLTVPGFELPPPGQPIKPQALPIPLFSNLPVQAPTSALSLVTSASGYRVDAILTLAERRGLLKILSRPRVVTQNNIGATVKQGVRVPVVTAAQLGGPPTVTYVEAALRLQVTPQVTAENTIFLNVDVENTTPDFSRQVQGNPTLITQQATTSVLVNDGGTVVIGGVIQTQNSVNTAQVPLLGDVPLLGNLFKRRSVETTTQELIFFITPKIVQT
jgi:type IV pilus assembly protein PilQ